MRVRALFVVLSVAIFGLIIFGAYTSPSTQKVTFRETLSSHPTPLISSYEVTDVIADGRYHLVGVSLDGNDQGIFILEGEYSVGDVITIMYSDTTMEDITGEVKVGEASELDK